MTDEAGLIYEKIPLIAAEIGTIAKTGTAPEKIGGYSYRKIDDVMAAVNPVMAAQKVSCFPVVIDSKHEIVQNRHHSILTVRHKFTAEDGSCEYTTTVGEGLDGGDKASNKAMAAAYKYALTLTFCTPTAESVDSEATAPEAGEQSVDGQKPTEPPAEGAPSCPKCGKSMERRTGAKGAFYGCTGYPGGCKGTVNIPAAGEQQSIPENKAKTRDECRKSLAAVCKSQDIEFDLFREWVKSEYVGKGISDMDLAKLRALEKVAQERPEDMLEKVTFFYQKKAEGEAELPAVEDVPF